MIFFLRSMPCQMCGYHVPADAPLHPFILHCPRIDLPCSHSWFFVFLFFLSQNQHFKGFFQLCLTERWTYKLMSLACFRPLVTSFSGKYGSIQYCVRAVLERPKVPDQSVKRELQVISHIDVNTPALLVSPSFFSSPFPPSLLAFNCVMYIEPV